MNTVEVHTTIRRAFLPTWAGLAFFLTIGVVIRLLALNSPIIDGMHLRQTQTADAIASMLREGGFPLDSAASWRGDLNARVVQEFPLYNHAVVVLVRAGIPLTVSGKIVSVLFWVIAFLALQAIWKRLLTPQETLWANLLFVFSPLSVFFGQAVMPESLVLALTFGFIAFWLRHLDTGDSLPLLAAGAVALLGLLVKPPGYFYVGAFAAFTLIATGRWKRLFDWRYIAIALVIGVCLKLWMNYSDAVSSVYFSRWSASENIERFMGPLSERVNPFFWFKIFAYSFFMVATPVPFLLAFTAMAGPRPDSAPGDRTRLLWCWAASLLVFVLVFGPHTAGNHSYYNLPMLPLYCAAFGIGAIKSLAWATRRFPLHGPRWIRIGFAAAAILSPLPILAHLYTPDRHTAEVARWIRDNTKPDEMVVVRYMHNPTPDIPSLSFLAERRLWIWAPRTPEFEKKRALETSRYAILIEPKPDSKNPVVVAWHRFRWPDPPPPETGFPPDGRFDEVFRTKQFTAFEK